MSHIYQTISPDRKNFTLIELMIVIAIIMILISILLPGLSKAKKTVFENNCRSNMRQLTTCVIFYANDHNGWSFGASYIKNNDDYRYLTPCMEYLKIPSKSSLFFCPSENDPEYAPMKKTAHYQINGKLGAETTQWAAITSGIGKNLFRMDSVRRPSELCWFFDSTDYYSNNISIRHGKAFNASYLDGHVGKRLMNSIACPSVTSITSYSSGFYWFYYLYTAEKLPFKY